MPAIVVANSDRRDNIRSISAVVGLIVLAGCATLRPAAHVQRAAVSAATCDSAGSVAAERATLASVARTLLELAYSSEGNAYATAQQGSASVNSSASSPRPAAAAVSASMIANANNARVQLLYAESRLDQDRARTVVGQIAALDAMARTLPTVSACQAAGFANATEPRS